MVSTSPWERQGASPVAASNRPAAHTCEVSGALATPSISLLKLLARTALGKALQEVPFQCCVEATYRLGSAWYSKPTAHALVVEEALMPWRIVTPAAALALGTRFQAVP